MAQPLAAKLLKLKPAPLVPDVVLAALVGRGELPDSVDALCNTLHAEAEAVAGLRERLALVPPAGVAEGCVLL